MNYLLIQYRIFEKEIREAIEKVLSGGSYILGKNLKLFEDRFANYIGAKYCVGVGNGLEALQLSLMALGIGKGDEVITVSNSFVATALAISAVGATPVFVDCDKYYLMDVSKIEEKITKKTKAIIPVHLFGQVCEMDSINRIAKKNKISVIEDACQAHGATYKNEKKAGNLGMMACFSFYPTKNLGAYGDGGAITTNSKELYESLLALRNYGSKTKYVHEVVGINSRLDELQAAILLVKLKHLKSIVRLKNNIANEYVKQLKGVKGVTLPLVKAGRHGYHQFVIQVDRRDELLTYLQERGVQAMIHYPVPIHKQSIYKSMKKVNLPKTMEYSKTILSLPISPFVPESMIDYACKCIREFLGNKLDSVKSVKTR